MTDASRKSTDFRNSPSGPPWLLDDYFFKKLPDEYQQTILAAVKPLYHRFVLQPIDHLERANGTSVFYLLWSELLKQAEIAVQPCDAGPADRLRQRMHFDDLFLLLGLKSKMSSLLIRLRQLNSKSQQPDPPFPFPIPAFPADIGETAPPLTNTPSLVGYVSTHQ